MWIRGLLVGLVAFTLGCAGGVSIVDGVAIAPDALLGEIACGTAQGETGLTAEKDVLAVSPEMRSFLDRNVRPRATAQVKLQSLIRAIISDDSFGLEFGERTRTASETFRLRRGNCLSFANLFVAMARAAGLDASFQEVDIPPDWTLDDEVFVLNRHVNVLVDLGPSGEHVVDFDIEDFRSGYDTRTISDARALAHFYNNVGVERLREGDAASAAANFRTAIVDCDRRFSPAWTNLGTLYLREGREVCAEAAYLEALRADPGDSVAMSNLTRLYERRGDTERAAALHKQVVRHRNRNPYYRYFLARQAYETGDYRTAVGHLKYAIRKKPGEARFYFLLGTSYLEQGKERRAERWLARAERVAAAGPSKHERSSTISWD